MRLLFREALLSFRRAPLLSSLSVTTIAFSLFTVGLFGLIAVNLRHALQGLAERVEIVAFVLRGTPPETITVWPENPMTDATPQHAQDAVDAGDDTLSWRTDPQRVAQRFGLFVLGWSDTQVAPATTSDGAVSGAGETFAIRPKCDGDEGANQPCGYSQPLLVHVAQPLRQGAGGIWSVVAVQAPGLDIAVSPSLHPAALPGDATIRFDLRVPRDRAVHIGLVARNGCSATTSLSPGLESGRHTLTLDEATRSVDADLACGAIGAGYVFAYVQADTTVPVGDPLLEAATIEYPWVSIMPVTFEMVEGTAT